ncbi:hypothetical protein L3V31_13780 [Vibrio sp. J1-1]|uniref:hypothetical protein n=1 Tax=Vibrio sp. J1-1 TaxID=2912251 RepID=UPI001F424789|nr:hypothetical protein [Vibrio sp. J1-1]MBR9876487.1 hypothetical protein [Vibrionaceae bacterium]MCF7482782.1 hypothetical protein [Vibrio sp. J1-1]
MSACQVILAELSTLRLFGYNSNLKKKLTQTVAFGVTSQKQLLYNALAKERWNRYKFGFLCLSG